MGRQLRRASGGARPAEDVGRAFRCTWKLLVLCTGEWRLWASLPTTTSMQIVRRRSVSEWTPSHKWTDRYGNRIEHGRFQDDREISIEFRCTLPNRPAPSHSYADCPPLVSIQPPYRDAGTFWDSPALAEIRRDAIRIAGGPERPAYARLHRLFCYLLVAFSWRLRPVRQTLLRAFQTLSGDCCDVSMVLVAMANAIGLPARPVFGFLCSTWDGHFHHVWAEVQIGENRWIPLDVGCAQEAALCPDMTELHYGVTDPMYFFGCQNPNVVVSSVGSGFPKSAGGTPRALTIEEWDLAMTEHPRPPVIPLLAPYWIEFGEQSRPSLTRSEWNVEEI